MLQQSELENPVSSGRAAARGIHTTGLIRKTRASSL